MGKFIKSLISITARISGFRNRVFFVLDFMFFSLAFPLSILIRFDNVDFNLLFSNNFIFLWLAFVAIKLIILFSLNLYQKLWKYASIDELGKIIFAGLVISFVQLFLVIFINELPYFNNFYLPRSVPIIDSLISIIFFSGLRLSIRITQRFRNRYINFSEDHERVLVVGAGIAGLMIVDEIQSRPELGYHIVGFLDDDKHKLNLRIRGLAVLGNVHNIARTIESEKVSYVIIAMPTAAGSRIKFINDHCRNLKIKVKTIPSISELIDGTINISKLREVKIEDLLRREHIETDLIKVKNFVKGKTVIVTGAGGSIGSELCRQISNYEPYKIVLLGHGENSIFDISNELKRTFNTLEIETTICDIRDLTRIAQIFTKHRPEVVFHAAAHKHVPLMECNPYEAVTNNIFGTFNLLQTAINVGVDNFVLISTDKAVNPTSIMGASKRVAELLVSYFAVEYKKCFVSVRFGNVLGSRGSVVPYFKKQIENGGPVTITHPDIKRYFMTIPEAVQLVLQAAAIGKLNEVFFLDMGEPIKIIDLAKDMIRLSGLKVDKDIQIKSIGLRPGEKLFEELNFSHESFSKTEHEKIYVVKNGNGFHTTEFDGKSTKNYSSIIDCINNLSDVVKNGDDYQIKEIIKTIVPEYDFQGAKLYGEIKLSK